MSFIYHEPEPGAHAIKTIGINVIERNAHEVIVRNLDDKDTVRIARVPTSDFDRAWTDGHLTGAFETVYFLSVRSGLAEAWGLSKQSPI